MPYPNILKGPVKDAFMRFKIPNCSDMQKRAIVGNNNGKGGWVFHKKNTIEHETEKFKYAFENWKNGGIGIMESEEIGSKPRRIIDYVDFLPTGRVRKVEFESKLKSALEKISDPEVCIVPVGNGWSERDLEKLKIAKEGIW